MVENVSQLGIRDERRSVHIAVARTAMSAMIITVFMNVSRIEALNPTEAFVWLARYNRANRFSNN
jgi:hypothetical protein